MSPVPLAPLARPDRSGLPHLPPIVSTTLRYLQVPPARRALPAHSIRSLVPARRVPSLPLGQGFVSLRSLVPSRRPTGSSLRDIICSRFLIRRPSRWAERRLRRSTGLGDDKNDRRRTPRPLETPHRSGKRHGTGRRVSLLAEVPMPRPGACGTIGTARQDDHPLNESLKALRAFAIGSRRDEVSSRPPPAITPGPAHP